MAMAKKRQCLTADCRFSAALLWIRRSSWRRNQAAFGDEVVVKTLVAGFDCYTAAPDFATASQPNAAWFLRQLLRGYPSLFGLVNDPRAALHHLVMVRQPV